MSYIGQGQPEKYFCYLYISSYQTAYLAIGENVSAIIMLFLVVSQYISTKRLHMMSNNIKLIYASLFCFLAFYFIRLISSQIIYWTQISIQHSSQQSQYLSKLSKYIFLIDTSVGFFMQSALILVCYNWMDRIVNLMRRLQDLQGESIVEDIKLSKCQIISRKVIKVYLIVRLFLYGMALIVLFVNNQAFIVILTGVIFIFYVIQSVAVPIILTIGILTIKRKTGLSSIVDKSQINTLVNQYTILIIGTFVKFIYGFVVALTALSGRTFNQCQIQRHSSDPKIIFYIILYVFYDILVDYVPCIILLRIFRISRENQMSESLLEVNQTKNTIQNQ